MAFALTGALLCLPACRPAPEKPAAETAEALYKAQKYREARIELMNALQRNPTDRKLLLLHARTLLELGEGEEAEANLRHARDLGIARSEIQLLLARALLQQGKAEQAIAELGKSEAADAYRMRGQAQMRLRKPDLAKAEFDAGIAKYPADAALLANRARLALDARQLADAQSYAARALKLAPTDLDALLVAGDSALAAGDRNAARAAYDEVIARYPQNVAAKLGKATILAAAGDKQGLAPLVDDLARRAPDNPVVIIMKARQLMDAKQYDEANRLLRDKAALIANQPDALMAAGEIALEQNYLSLAIDRFEQVLKIAPDNRKARYLLARAYIREGDQASARNTLWPLLGAKDMPPDLAVILVPPTIPGTPPNNGIKR